MKKIIAVFMALTLTLLICGCGKSLAKPSKKLPADNTSSDEISEEAEGDYEEKIIVGSTAPVVGDAVYDLEFNTADIETVEYGTHGPTLKTKWDASSTVTSSESDKEAAALRNKILSTGNTDEIYNITGKKYYVSPKGNDDNDGLTPATAFKTVNSKAFTSMVKPGDAVLFERGGVWRLSNSIKAREGVTYGSYGTGEKPAFYMSPYNYAMPEFWLPSKRENIWKVSAADNDIGLIVFNEGEIVGDKKSSGLVALEKTGDYFYNREQDTVYVYCDKGNPGKVFNDIEICFSKAVFSVSRVENVTIDNLKIKYGGSMAVSMVTSDGSTVTNCEIGFIGGAYQNVKEMLRYGNAIQQWNSVYNQVVENNWIYQVYDTAISWQGDYSWIMSNDVVYNEDKTINYDLSRIDQYKNISYCNNLIEYCAMSIEFWHASRTAADKEKKLCRAPVENFDCSNNISRFAGYGWTTQRADHVGSHIMVYSRAFPEAKNCKIQNNIFDCSYSYMVRWDFNNSKYNAGFDISGNTYYQRKAKVNEGMWYGSMISATNQSTLESAVSIFDKSPKLVKWIKK